MSEVTELHNPFRSFLKAQGLHYRYSNPTKATSENASDADFWVVEHGRILMIEFKTKNGKISTKQVFRFAELEKAGCHVFVQRDLETACNIVLEWRGQSADRIPVNHPAHKPVVLWKGASLRERPDGSYDIV